MAKRVRKPFRITYERLEREITNTAYGQRIPGMLIDEVRSEMLEVLWKAHVSFDATQGASLPQYWWSCWQHRKADLIEAAFRQKRDISKEVLVNITLPGSEESAGAVDNSWWEALAPLVTYDDVVERMIPPVPDIISDKVSYSLASGVWRLLAVGYTRKDVLALAGISTTTYYQVISSWRCDEVRRRLA